MTMSLSMNVEEKSLATCWSLVARIKNTGDEKSWHQFYELYRGLVFGVAVKAGLWQEEAQEVLQETMASVSKKIQDFEANPARGSFRAWLLQMARWRIADQFRKRLPTSECGGLQPELATSTTPTVERIADTVPVDLERLCDSQWKEKLTELALQKVQQETKAEHYQVLHLLLVEGKSVPEVSHMVGRNAAQIYLIRHRLTRLLKKIAKQLEKEME